MWLHLYLRVCNISEHVLENVVFNNLNYYMYQLLVIIACRSKNKIIIIFVKQYLALRIILLMLGLVVFVLQYETILLSKESILKYCIKSIFNSGLCSIDSSSSLQLRIFSFFFQLFQHDSEVSTLFDVNPNHWYKMDIMSYPANCCYQSKCEMGIPQLAYTLYLNS